MNEYKGRTIIVTNDLDGVHFHAPTPMGSLLELALNKRLTVPGDSDVLRPYIEPSTHLGKVIERVDQLFHQMRPFDKKGCVALERMMRSGMYFERNVGFNALSGREPYLHSLTVDRLEENGYIEFFGDDLMLNPGRGSAISKRIGVKELLSYGLNVVHIEDDVKAAIAVGSLSPVEEEQRVLVYLRNGLSNHPRLLKRAGVVLPPNVIRYKSLDEVPSDFHSRLERREI